MKTIFNLVGLVILSVFLLPTFKLFGFGIRLDDLLLLFFTPFIILIKKKIISSNVLTYSVLFCSTALSAIIYGYYFLNINPNIGDLNEFIRYLKIPLFAILVSYLDKDYLVTILDKLLYHITIILIIIGFIEFFNPFGLGDIISKIYSSEGHFEVSTSNYIKRITLTGSGPNDGAIIASYLVFFNFFNYLYNTNKNNFIKFLFTLTVLLFTQSRTVIIGVFTSILFMLFLIKGYYKIKVFIISFITVSLFYLAPYFVYVYTGMIAFINGEDNSFLIRQQNAEIALKTFKSSKIIGHGIAKNFIDIRMDSEYLSILVKFGIIGLIISIFFLTLPFIEYKNVKSINDKKLYIIFYTLTSNSLLGFIIMITNDFITGYQSFLPFVLLNSILTIYIKNFKNENIKVNCQLS